MLADHGAEVLKIESAVHPDGLRVMALPRPPWTDSLNQSGIFTLMNTSKRSVTINMATEGGPALLRRLIALADVVVDNYGVDPLPKWGLTPDELMKSVLTSLWPAHRSWGGPDRTPSTSVSATRSGQRPG